MKLLRHLTFVNLVLHLIVSGLYLVINEFGSFKEYDLAVMYFGTEGVFCSAGIMLATNSKAWIEKQFSHIHSLFILLRGTVYVLHYTGYESGNLERLIWTCIFTLLMVAVFNLKCYFYGYYNER